MVKFSVNRGGFRRTQKSLEDIVQQVQRRAMKQALMKAAQPGLKAARAKVPTRHGHLRKALKKKGKTFGKFNAYVIVGPDRNYAAKVGGKTVKPVKYAHLVEFGTMEQAPEAYMRPAFESETAEMKKIYEREIGLALEKQARAAERRMLRKISRR